MMGDADRQTVLTGDTHTHTRLSHPLPLPLLVEQDDDQLGVHLVSVLAERQIPPLERHIHQVPVEGHTARRQRDSFRRHWRLSRRLLCAWLFSGHVNVSFKAFISSDKQTDMTQIHHLPGNGDWCLSRVFKNR